VYGNEGKGVGTEKDRRSPVGKLKVMGGSGEPLPGKQGGKEVERKEEELRSIHRWGWRGGGKRGTAGGGTIYV